MSSQRIFYEPKQLSIEFGEKDSQYYFTSKSSLSPTQESILPNLPTYLTEKVIVIDSIYSGTGRTKEKDIYDHILSPLFQQLEILYELFKTNSSTSIVEYAQNIQVDSNANVTVIFISGDSSINEFVNALQPEKSGKISIFPIPGGTGNSLALSLNITNPIDSIIRLLQGKQLPLYLYDVDFSQGSYYLTHDEKRDQVQSTGLKFLVVLSWGFHASLVADSDTLELRKHGLERFQIAAFQNLNREQKYEGDLYINEVGEQIRGPFAYWLVVSSLRFEPKFEISPKGDILKDELYLVAFNTKDNDKDYIMDIMKQVYDNGKHITNPDVIYKKLGPEDRITLKVKNSKPLIQRRFCVDGRIVALPEKDDNEIKVSITDNSQHSWKLFIIH